MFTKCSRCGNGNIKYDHKYCSICGLKLEEAKKDGDK